MARSQSGYDRHITVFSPEGKLYQVEYAIQAVKGCNLTAIGVKGAEAACLVVQKKVPLQQLQQDQLLDPACVTSLFSLTENIGGAMVGMPADCRAMVSRSRQVAAEFAYSKGYTIPVHYLCRKIADINQIYTQHAYMRLHACTGIMIGVDDEAGPSVYRFDPAGWYAGYKACAAGAKEQEATHALDKVVRKNERTSEDDTVQAAIGCLQNILAVDFKKTDIEVGVVSTRDPKFRVLTADEIDNHLTAISEKD